MTFHRSLNKFVLLQKVSKEILHFSYTGDNCCYRLFKLQQRGFVTFLCNVPGQHDWRPLNHSSANNPNQHFIDSVQTSGSQCFLKKYIPDSLKLFLNSQGKILPIFLSFLDLQICVLKCQAISIIILALCLKTFSSLGILENLDVLTPRKNLCSCFYR